MFPFSAFLREQDEEPVDGDDWANPCPVITNPVDGDDWVNPCPVITNPCLPSDATDDSPPTLEHRQSNSRRIDMAAEINEDFSVPLGLVPSKDPEAADGDTLRTRDEWSANGSEQAGSESLQRNCKGVSAWNCTSCMCRIWFVISTLLVLFTIGLGVGLATRNNPSNPSSLEASAQTQITGNPISSGTRPPSPPVSLPTQTPASSPIQIPVSSPTEGAVSLPTQTSVSLPTEAATSLPTEIPVNPPTEAAASLPTEIPVSSPTAASLPTEIPVSPPTEIPVSSPTEAAVSAPTEIPVSPPTEIPVSSPTEAAVSAPIQSPTPYPTVLFHWDFDPEELQQDDDRTYNENWNDLSESLSDVGTGVQSVQDEGVNYVTQSYQEWDTQASPYLVGAYYYPWYGNNFHNGDGYVRRDLEPRHVPTLGEYDDSTPEVVGQHIRWSRQANIGLWITSWWGPERLEDYTTKDVILQHEDLGDLKIALHYETSNRVKGGVTGISDDMSYMCENYFDHPNYYKVNGRPVIFVYITRVLQTEGLLEATILTMRTAASKCGHDVFLVGDQVFQSAPDEAQVYNPFWYFDAVTNYDVYGSMGMPSPYAGSAAVDNYYSQQEQWRTVAHEQGCRYIPAVSPGYNDRGVRYQKNHPPLSRKLDENSAEGTLFAYQLSKAKLLVDSDLDNLLVVNSFNEWHEDTQIEPCVGERTNSPFNMTQGVYYEGYGEVYLDILREGTLQR